MLATAAPMNLLRDPVLFGARRADLGFPGQARRPLVSSPPSCHWENNDNIDLVIRQRLWTAEGLRLCALLGVFGAGSYLRVRYYAADFSLFLDECALTLNLQHRSYTALSQTLDNNQAAPLGFLYVLKALTGSLGFRENVLRLFPLICGLGTIAAFYLLTRQIFSGWALVAANLLMSVNQTAISYSAQVKQYSLELMVAVLMLLLSRPLFDRNCRSRFFWISSLVLGLLPWFSFTAVFVLAGIGLALLLGELWSPGGAGVRRTVGVLLLWGVLLIPVYVISIRPSTANPALRALWSPEYFPLHALSAVPHWIAAKMEEVCTMSFNKRLWPLAAIGIIFGLVASILRRNLLLLAASGGVLACLGAAALQRYPFGDRLILFLMPAFILLVVAGYQWLRWLFPRNIRIASDLIAASALLWCLASAVKTYVVRPSFIDEPREALRFVRSNWQDGDRLYATPLSTPCVIYYGRLLDRPNSDVALNVFALDGAQHSPTALSVPVSPGRDWLVEMRTDWEKRGESVPVREYFEARAKRLARKDVEYTSATLYQVR